VHTYAEEITMHLEHAGKTVLYDDRDASAGQKFADSDLIGIPIRIVVSEKHLGDKTVEVKRRTERSSAVMPLAGLLAALDAH
jgi:prolyl-tRNA synthetase